MSGCLSNYKNLIDWAINAHVEEMLPTLPQRKDDLLRQVNEKLGTNYQRKHLDNWFAGRSATPKRVREMLIDMLIEVEVEFDYSELGEQLRRLLRT